MTALALDLASGKFSGKWNGMPIPYCGKDLPAIAGTSDFQDALAGVQQLQYVSAAFAFGGLANILTVNVLANVALDGSEIYPLPPLAAIGTAISGASPPIKLPLPEMITGRTFATATLLANGNVLIVGGTGIGGTFFTKDGTDIYNPTLGRMHVGPPTEDRVGAASVRLHSGKVLIVGGINENYLATTEIYDPETDSIVPGPSMTEARYRPTATLLPNGTVLIAGGYYQNGPSSVTTSTDIYNPASNSIVQGPSMSTDHSNAVLLPDGRVLLAGIYSSTDIYDPITNSFAVGPNMNTGRLQPASSLLIDGRVLFAGGVDFSDGVLLNSTEIYDPAMNAFVVGPPLNVPRLGATATLMPNGQVLIAGGQNDMGFLNTTEIYYPEGNFIFPGPLLSVPREGATATLLPMGGVLIAGGDAGEGAWSTMDLYTP